MARQVSRGTIRVTRATRRRAQRVAEVKARRVAERHDPHAEPETLAQAKVYDRKVKRYEIAGLCHGCASQAAWGHALGFGKIKDPCDACQSIVATFPDPGPRGSKWRKCLLKLEYLSAEEVEELFA